jgi:hypothetical protein
MMRRVNFFSQARGVERKSVWATIEFLGREAGTIIGIGKYNIASIELASERKVGKRWRVRLVS